MTRAWIRFPAWLPLVVLAVGWIVPPVVGQVQAGSDPGADVLPIDELPAVAERGDFQTVLHRLKEDPYGTQNPQAASLIHDLERFHQLEADHALKRQQAYQEAFDEMVKLTDEKKFEDAMVSAIDAYSHADDPSLMLQSLQVRSLTQKTEEVARQAEWVGDWVEALSLYRMLDLLYDDFATYHDRVKVAARHVRVLRMYAPQQLQRLYAARAKRLGKDEPPAIPQEEETWEEKLDGIEMPMLRQVLAQTVRRHVDNPSYVPMLRSAIENLQIMANTQGLDDTFPDLGDKVRLARFREHLGKLQDELSRTRRPIDFLEAAEYLDRLAAINAKSVHLPEPVMVAELTDGALSALDEFSSVIWPTDKKNFSRNTRGKFSGVGISIAIRDGRLVVVSPLEGTPAHQAGIQAGDVIVTVDGRDSTHWGLDRAVREITGPKGTQVQLGVERPGQRENLAFDLTRDEIVIRSVRGWKRKTTGGWSFYIDPDHRVGYLRLSQFIPQTAEDLDEAINQMENENGLNALIIDLRFNPGGLLSSAVEVADRFIRSGPIVATVGPDGEETRPFGARPDHTHRPFPVAVLINEGSASASEIVAGALQDYDRAVIVGARSFGKGSVQDLFHLDRGRAYLKLTTQYYKLPQGRIIHRKPDAQKWGIEPDLTVKMTTQQIADAIEFRQNADVLRDADGEPALDEEPPPDVDQIIEQDMDPQLGAALLILKTHLVAEHFALVQRN